MHELVISMVVEGSSNEESMLMNEISMIMIHHCIMGAPRHNVCVQFLLDSGADPCIKNKFDGYNPLQYAVEYCNITALRLLLERHPNCLNCQDKWGRTLLHQAIYGDISYLKLLLEYGVDPCIRNKQSKLPEELVTNQDKIVLIQSYKFSFTKSALEPDDY